MTSFVSAPRYRWYCEKCDLHHIKRVLWPLSQMRCSNCGGMALLKVVKKPKGKTKKKKHKKERG